MKKVITETALADIREISAFIHTGNPARARDYRRDVLITFKGLDDTVMYRRADDSLPKYVREISVRGFASYFIRVAYLDDKIGVVAAFRPGLTEGMKNQRTHTGLREIKRS